LRSSTAYAGSSLEVPAVTVADRLAGVLVLLAGLFTAWACARAGAVGLAALAGTVAGAVAARQAISWTRSRWQPPLVLEHLADGRLQVRQGTGRPVPLALGTRTRLLGPSVYLDFTCAFTPREVRCLRWITPFDVPAQALRRWTVLLPGAASRAS
jgi:hypothetical protein